MGGSRAGSEFMAASNEKSSDQPAGASKETAATPVPAACRPRRAGSYAGA